MSARSLSRSAKRETIVKSFKSYLLIAILSLSTVSVPSAFSSNVTPVKGIDVIVQKNPGGSARQTATVDKNGNLSVELPGPGNYTIKYADGPKKGQVIKTVTVTKAGPVSLPKSAAE